MIIKNKQVGAAPKALRWSRSPARDAYTTTVGGVSAYAIRRYRAQWVLRVGDAYLPHVFEGARACQRYAAGAAITH